MFFKFISYVMILFFLMSVAVQYNDPDGSVWMFAYGIILLTTLLIILKPDPVIRMVLYPLLIAFGIGVFQWSGSFADTSLDAFMAVGMKNITQEEVRELWGLVICLIWTIVLTIYSYRYNYNYDEE